MANWKKFRTTTGLMKQVRYSPLTWVCHRYHVIGLLCIKHCTDRHIIPRMIPYKQGPPLLRWFNLILPWISNYIHYKMLEEIIYPFQNLGWSLGMDIELLQISYLSTWWLSQYQSKLYTISNNELNVHMTLGERTNGPKRHSECVIYWIEDNNHTAWNPNDMGPYLKYVSDH